MAVVEAPESFLLAVLDAPESSLMAVVEAPESYLMAVVDAPESFLLAVLEALESFLMVVVVTESLWMAEADLEGKSCSEAGLWAGWGRSWRGPAWWGS